MAESSAALQLVLVEVKPGTEIVAPAGMQVGDSLSIPASVAGRWITLGSGRDQDIVLRDEPRGVRRSHCRMTFRNGGYQIQGRLQPGGYAINGEPFHDCTARPLKDGDLITIGGNVTLRFTVSDLVNDTVPGTVEQGCTGWTG